VVRADDERVELPPTDILSVGRFGVPLGEMYMEIPVGGLIAQLLDPQGPAFALHQAKG
jgi:predicted enzyme related to lactoylglutathione lyase